MNVNELKKIQEFSKNLWAEFVKESEDWTVETYVQWLIIRLHKHENKNV
jgi:hypothetical protein